MAHRNASSAPFVVAIASPKKVAPQLTVTMLTGLHPTMPGPDGRDDPHQLTQAPIHPPCADRHVLAKSG